ncbi:MAG: glycosyltransferase family 2 protein [Undibacterium sp.]|nr:glycosyltransferase family 2 protein [Opitutaceae bacterium]
MNSSKISVSIIIPVRNEAANLPRCLASVAWADEIFVVDSQSTDDSVAIATAAGAQVVQFNFNGIWPKKKNWALENLPFRHEWILILDADEVMPPAAAAEIEALLARDGAGRAGFWINRRFMFMGDWLRHSYYPNWNLRLFRHRLGRYERLVQGATQSGDNEVHEHVVVSGKTGRLRCEMDHFAFPSIDVFVEKHNRYSNWEARLEVEAGLKAGDGALQSSAVDFRRRLKRWSRRLPFRPTLRFLYVYLIQRGFLDGARGFYFARLHAVYEFMSVAKAAEMRLQQPAAPSGARAQMAVVRSVGA